MHFRFSSFKKAVLVLLIPTWLFYLKMPGKSLALKKDPIFVIQKHNARKLHYDFRLESGGVLKSWAVPKIPSTNPSIKRLAVEVEDHPISYANFEGEIPKGSYGAGTVEIWDSGTYQMIKDKSFEESYKDGLIEIVLDGEKLNGAYALIRFGSESETHHGLKAENITVTANKNWMLKKMKSKKS